MIDDFREQLRRAKRDLQLVLERLLETADEAVTAAAAVMRTVLDWVSANEEDILRAIRWLLLGIVVIGLLIAVLSAIVTFMSGGSTAPATAPAGLAGLLVAATALVALCVVAGLETDPMRSAVSHVIAGLRPDLEPAASGADYERDPDAPGRPEFPQTAAAAASQPSSEEVLLAAARQLADPWPLLARAMTRDLTRSEIGTLRSGIDALAAVGDSVTADLVRSHLQRAGLG